MCNAAAIHFSVMVVSARNRCAKRTFFRSPLRRRLSSSSIHPSRSSSAQTIARAFSDTFAGIAPASAPAFIAAQVIGAVLAVGIARFWITGES